MTPSAAGAKFILPPKGLLIALSAQLPLALIAYPLHTSAVGLAAGAVLLLAGVAVNVWAKRRFRGAEVGVRPFSPAPVVVASGPYRFTRNPMYLGLIGINQSAVFLSGVLLNAWTSVVYAIWLHRVFVMPEERFLLRVLGAPFAAYARQVPRWISWGRRPAQSI